MVRWWGNPEEQAGLLPDDMSDPRMAMQIVCCDATPFAYVQDYDVHTWPQPHFNHLPAGSRAIDTFIGEPAMIGRGHGSAFLKLLVRRLVTQGAPLVAVDPEVANLRGRRAYGLAGFCGDSIVATESGPAILMLFAGEQFERS
jgi:aminoglycoside 6'-N-acetyltransferase